MRFTFITIIALWSSLTACNAVSQNKPNSFPIDTDINKADSTFTSVNLTTNGIGEKNIGKLYWYLSDQQALNGDVVKQIKSCENNQFLICITSPIPLILPIKLVEEVNYEIDESVFSFKVAKQLAGKITCDFDTLDFAITNEQSETYRYVISKVEGLLYVSVITQEGLGDTEMFRLSGNVFSYGEFCN